MMNVEESRLVNMTTRLEEPDPLDTLDMTKAPSEMFLDGCKVNTKGQLSEIVERQIAIIFLSVSLNMCFGCSKETSH